MSLRLKPIHTYSPSPSDTTRIYVQDARRTNTYPLFSAKNVAKNIAWKKGLNAANPQ